jgi:hypothetical protein
MKRLCRTLSLGVLTYLLASGTVFAQATGQISGRATDTTGAVLPGVTISLTRTDTGLIRTATTNESGGYTFPSLPTGTYQFEATLPGFRTFVQSGIVVQVNTNITIDVALQLGQVEETIQVEANSPIQVELRNLGIGTVIDTERILELPLPARQVTDLITLSGAAVEVPSGPVGAMVTGVNISIAGGGDFGVQHRLDGALHNNRFFESNLPMPFPDALAEFRVSTSVQEASAGRSSGGAVSSVTKSGTNQPHGTLFWFVRNAAFNARAADAPIKDQLKRNQPGFSVGGPLVQNRLFFFTGYQSTIVRSQPRSNLAIVPTPAILQGDWSAFNQCFNPNWRDADFRDGFVDPARYSNAARLLAARLPQTTDPCGQLRFGLREEQHDKQTVNRIDYQHSTSHNVFGRYMATFIKRPPASDPDNIVTIVNEARGNDDRAHQGVVGHTWVLSPRAITASRVAFNRIITNFDQVRFFDPRDVGINQWTSIPDHFALAVTNHFGFGAGQAFRDVSQDQFELGNDTTLHVGAHQISLGGVFARDDIQSVAHTRGIGGITFTADVTGNAMGDFLLGRVNNIRQSMPSLLSLHQPYLSLYAQDAWTATPRLTLNYGVRWEPFFPMVWDEMAGELGGVRVYRFSAEAFKAGQKSVVFPNAPAGFTYPQQGGSGPADFDGRSGLAPQYKQFAPRLGLAWDPRGRGETSIRVGYGVAYDVVGMRLLLNSNNVSPWAADILHRNGTLDDPWQGLAGGNPFPFDFRVTPQFASGSVFLPFPEKLEGTNVQSWNVDFQQQLIGRWRVSVGYIGRRSGNLWNTDAVNPALFLTQGTHPALFTGPDTCVLEGQSFTPCNQLGNLNQRRELRLWSAANRPDLLPDARLFSTVDLWSADGTAQYHGLLTTARGTLAGVNLNGNYTLSRCESDRVNVAITNPNQTAHNVDTKDRAKCFSDRRHIVNLTAVATTPRLGGRGALSAIGSEWTVAVTFRARSGEPLSITTTDRSLTGLLGQVVNQVSDDVTLDTSGNLNSQYLNPAAFALPALGTFGNSGFFSVPGIGTWDLDLAVSRAFRIAGDSRLELRAEVFNPTNAVRALNPVANFNAGNFGRIINVRDPRIMQWALRYLF